MTDDEKAMALLDDAAENLEAAQRDLERIRDSLTGGA